MKLLTEVHDSVKVITEGKDGARKYFLEGIFIQGDLVNRNGREYPIDTLSEEIDRYSKEHIDTNRAYGELGHPECFHGRTEALTIDGWKKIKDISIGEMVYTLNPKTGSTEIQPVRNVYNKSYTGKMIQISGRGIDTQVTPNHRVIIKDRTGSFKFKTAQELFDSPNSHDCIWKDSIFTKVGDSHKMIAGQNVEFNLFCSFLALYLSEGCVSHRKGRNRSYVIQINQNVGSKADHIRSILNELPWSFSEDIRDKKITWKCHNADLAEYLKPMGKAHTKYIPKDIISNMDVISATHFLESYIVGDGRGKLNNKYTRCDVFSVSERMIDDISHVAFLAGIPTRKTVEVCDKDYTFAGRLIKKENKKPLYFCKFLASKGIYTDRRFIKITENNEYSDVVHCLNVENGTFYVRDGEYTFWTGNSPTIQLERVSHMIRSLTRDGNNFIGRAEILGTPNGNIVKALIDAGATLGVSSRGVGTLKQQGAKNIVQPDFRLMTAADIVADPSAPEAFVTAVMEEKEWIWNNGKLQEKKASQLKKRINKVSQNDLMEEKIRIFQEWLSEL